KRCTSVALRIFHVEARRRAPEGTHYLVLAKTRDVLDRLVHGHLDAFTTVPVTDLDNAVGDSLAHDHDRRHPDQFRIGELHAGRHVAVIQDHAYTGLVKIGSKPLTRGPHRLVLTRDDHVRVGGRHGT